MLLSIWFICALIAVKSAGEGNYLQPQFEEYRSALLNDGVFHNPLPWSEKVETSLDLTQLQYHGTTTVAFKNGNSIIVCVDSKASIGKYVGSRTVKKVFPISKHVVATMAGGAADCAYWIRNIAAFKKVFECQYGMQEMPVYAIAKVLARKLAEFRGAGLSVGTMIAGYDTRTKEPSCK
jgi:20S proteasome alpha/beta subunit